MNYVGYVTSRSFGPIMMPVPAQNSCLREYVNRRGGNYILPALESNYANCYHQLFGTIKTIKENSVLIMYSILMLPDEEKKRKKIYDLASSKNMNFAFVMENLETSNQFRIEDEIKVYDLKPFSQSIKDFKVNLVKYK